MIPDSFNPLPKPHRSPARTGSLPDGFEAFWSTYPCKKAKTKAVKVWESLNPDAQLLAAILTGIERDKQSDQWQRDDGRFIPHPVTWLNGRRWEDETGNANASTSPSAWWELSGFSSEAEAIDAGCQQWNWREFSAGKRIEGVTA
uniref:Uncharacterized protein n=1 Tax=mine drainage metagenome TaxID=410659 RepID=E6PQ91_9ZZZZ